MNRIRITVAAAALLMATAGIANAQAPGADRRAPRAENRRTPADHLNLTDAQEQSIRAVHERYRSQFDSLHDRQRAEIRALLTAEQQAKFDAQAATRRERMAARDGRAGKRREGGRKARPNRGPRPELRRG